MSLKITYSDRACEKFYHIEAAIGKCAVTNPQRKEKSANFVLNIKDELHLNNLCTMYMQASSASLTKQLCRFTTPSPLPQQKNYVGLKFFLFFHSSEIQLFHHFPLFVQWYTHRGVQKYRLFTHT